MVGRPTDPDLLQNDQKSALKNLAYLELWNDFFAKKGKKHNKLIPPVFYYLTNLVNTLGPSGSLPRP
jgi:hypothetical protein